MSNYNPYTKRQTMIAPDYEVYRYRSTYMNEVELHHHDFYEIYLLLRGRVEYIVENQLYRVRPGDWMLCSPLELHQARIATDADFNESAFFLRSVSQLLRLTGVPAHNRESICVMNS